MLYFVRYHVVHVIACLFTDACLKKFQCVAVFHGYAPFVDAAVRFLFEFYKNLVVIAGIFIIRTQPQLFLKRGLGYRVSYNRIVVSVVINVEKTVSFAADAVCV